MNQFPAGIVKKKTELRLLKQKQKVKQQASRLRWRTMLPQPILWTNWKQVCRWNLLQKSILITGKWLYLIQPGCPGMCDHHKRVSYPWYTGCFYSGYQHWISWRLNWAIFKLELLTRYEGVNTLYSDDVLDPV